MAAECKFDVDTVDKYGATLITGIHNNGTHIVCSQFHHILRIFNLRNPNLCHTIKKATKPICLTPDGRHVLYVPISECLTNIAVAHLKTGEVVSIIKTTHTNVINDICVTPNNKFLVSASRDCTVRITSLQTGKLDRVITHYKDDKDVVGVCVTPDGSKVVSFSHGDGHRIRVSNLKTGELVRQIHGYTTNIIRCKPLCVTPDNKYIVSNCQNFLSVFNLQTGDFVRAIKAYDVLEGRGYSKGICSVCVTPDAKHVIASVYNRPIRIVNLQTGKLFCDIDRNFYSYSFVCLTPDGKYMVSTENNKIRVIKNPVYIHRLKIYKEWFRFMLRNGEYKTNALLFFFRRYPGLLRFIGRKMIIYAY